jgi:hypothetical protein
MMKMPGERSISAVQGRQAREHWEQTDPVAPAVQRIAG